jgi:hypothetical protein
VAISVGGSDDRTTRTAPPAFCASGTKTAAAGDSIKL